MGSVVLGPATCKAAVLAAVLLGIAVVADRLGPWTTSLRFDTAQIEKTSS